MNPPAALVLALALIGAGVGTGCGLGPGESQSGEASLVVTRDFGAETMVDATVEDPRESDTVIRVLDREADIETSYGGNFVDSIDGVAGQGRGGDLDWFFFVNGYFSEIGGGEAPVRPGDRIWWDYRDWSGAARIPVVVGSWPEPFLHGEEGTAPPLVVECLTAEDVCGTVAERLEEAGADPQVRDLRLPEAVAGSLRVLVGPWERLRADPAARDMEAGPQRSGVYALPQRCPDGEWGLLVQGAAGQPRAGLAPAGFVAAVERPGEEATWLVAGTSDGEAVREAAELLDADSLRNRYAVAVSGGEEQPIPAAAGSGADDPEPCS